MHFATRATPIDDINSKSYKILNQLIKVKITPLVIYGFRSGHIHILWRNESDLKKPGARRPAAGTHLV